jgi:hypothetical protein
MVVKYIVEQLVMWVGDFFRHWYVDGFKFFLKALISMLSSFDRVFALRVSAKNIFKPMYQDNSFIGYMLGFIFRSGRITGAIIVYSIVVSCFVIVYILWAAIPPYLISKSININVADIL